MATAMLENFPILEKAESSLLSNRTNKASTRVCVSLSTEPLITCGEFGFMERIDSPLSEARYLDRGDMPLVPEDLFRFSLNHEQIHHHPNREYGLD